MAIIRSGSNSTLTFDTIADLQAYSITRVDVEAYVNDTSGDGNSLGGSGRYKSRVDTNGVYVWDRIDESLVISKELKDLSLDIDVNGNANSPDEDISEFTNPRIASAQNGDSIIEIEYDMSDTSDSSLPQLVSPNIIFVGSSFFGKKLLISANVTKTFDKNADFSGDQNHNLTKTRLGLDQVDNTSDINKPISTAVQIALDSKQDINTSSQDLQLLYQQSFSHTTSKSIYSPYNYYYIMNNYKVIYFIIDTTEHNSVLTLPTLNLGYNESFELGKYESRYVTVSTPSSSSSLVWNFYSGNVYITSIRMLGDKK